MMNTPSSGDTNSEMSGTADDIVQARDVNGGIHFHRPGGRLPLPRQLPGDIAGFVNRIGELRQLEAVLSDFPNAPLLVSVGGRCLRRRPGCSGGSPCILAPSSAARRWRRSPGSTGSTAGTPVTPWTH